MTPDDPARRVERTYLALTLLTTLAASFIWGINTLFLLDAGLNNAEAFAANAFFTVGQVIFEVPTGVVADTRGRQFSYVLGAGTLASGIRGVAVGSWLAAGIASDVADAAILTAAAQNRAIGPVHGRLVAGTAVAAAAAGVWAAADVFQHRRPSA